MVASLLPMVKARFDDVNGLPLSGGKVYSYIAGTSTPRATFSDQPGLVPNTNPVILDSRGEANIWLKPGSWKIVVADALDNILYTIDKIKPPEASALPDGGTTGQVLGKLSGNDGDVDWLTIDSLANLTLTGPLKAEIEGDTSTGSNQTLSTPTKLFKRSTGALLSIAGFTAPTGVQVFSWTNATGSDVDIINDATATAVDRILTGTGQNLKVKSGASIWLFYDTSSSRWRIIGGAGGGSGGFGKVTTVTATGTIAADDECIRVNAAGGSITLTLPAASSGNIGKVYNIKRIDSVDANSVTIQRAGSDTLEGGTSQTIPFQYGTLRIVQVTATAWELF